MNLLIELRINEVLALNIDKAEPCKRFTSIIDLLSNNYIRHREVLALKGCCEIGIGMLILQKIYGCWRLSITLVRLDPIPLIRSFLWSGIVLIEALPWIAKAYPDLFTLTV